MKVALITGITGQDGSYLAELLLEKGYIVHGVKRRASSFNTQRIDHIYQDLHETHVHFKLHYGDLTSTSELYGGLAENKNEKGFYDEHSPFYPRSPYGAAKIYGFWITKNYREAYNMFACNGILFNHESPRRGETFVTRKITMATAAIALKEQECLYLGNLDAQRDWGHAKDYVEAMWRILQQDVAEDYVIAMGETTYVRDFVKMAFLELGIEIEFKGEGVNEKGFVVSCSNPDFQIQIGKQVIAVDPQYFRPTEVDLLIGDPTKSKTKLGWKPQYDLAGLVKEMIEADVVRVKKEIMLKQSRI